jgi:S-disulfanyl-L-cysteine oxidoreductase SoxD
MIMRAPTIPSLVLPLCLCAPSLFLAGCDPAPGEQGLGSATTVASAPASISAGLDDAVLPPRFGFGRAATEAEIAVLDIDVSPDGTGLPTGQGTVAAGAAVYAAQCAVCHGQEGEGVSQVGNRLVGKEPIDSTGWNRTIGNYWPYATTVFDYIRRSMPFDRPGSLSDEEVYALTAFLLHLNGIVPADAVMDARTLPRVVMPARNRFVRDDREPSTNVR